MSLDKYYINTYGQNALTIYRKSKQHYDSIIGTSNPKNSNKKINNHRNITFLQNSVKRQHHHLKLKQSCSKKDKNLQKKEKIQSATKKQRYSYCSACSPPPSSDKRSISTAKKIQNIIYKLQQKTYKKKHKKCSKHSSVNISCIYQFADILQKIEIPNIMNLFKKILENTLVSIESLEHKIYELQQLNSMHQKNIQLLNNRLSYQKSHHYSLHKSYSLPQCQNQRQFTLLTHIETLQKQLEIYRNNQQNLFTAINFYTEKPRKIEQHQRYRHNLQYDNQRQNEI